MPTANSEAPYYVLNARKRGVDVPSYDQARVAAIAQAGETGSATIYQTAPPKHAIETFIKADDSPVIIGQLLCDHDPGDVCPNIGDPL